MSDSQDLAHRLRELYLDGKWIAHTNYREQLQQVNLQEATRRIGDLNSIAALTFHIDYYLAGLLQVLRGGPLDIKDRYSFDLPPLQSEADWASLREGMLEHARQFVEEVSRLSDGQLEAPFVDERYGSYRRNLEAVIEHGYYHLGQITLLRKLIIGGEQESLP